MKRKLKRVLDIQGGVLTRRGKSNRFFGLCPQNEGGKSNCHAELVSASIKNQTLKRVQGDKINCNEFNHIHNIHLKKLAFTLAEVLITIGVIGVVAAMTIPTLMANIRGQQYRSQFKKTMSTLSQAARMSQEKYGYDFAGIDPKCESPATDSPENVQTICALLNGTLSGITYLGSARDLDYSLPNDFNSDFLVYQLANGSLIMFNKVSNSNLGACHFDVGVRLHVGYDYYDAMEYCTGFIDVNGLSLPNEIVSCEDNDIQGDFHQFQDLGSCTVKAKNIKDIYPIVFHDGIVEPFSYAAEYMYKTAK